jgi:hypothetical protein
MCSVAANDRRPFGLPLTTIFVVCIVSSPAPVSVLSHSATSILVFPFLVVQFTGSVPPTSLV